MHPPTLFFESVDASKKVNVYASTYFQNKTKVVNNSLIMVTFINTLIKVNIQIIIVLYKS